MKKLEFKDMENLNGGSCVSRIRGGAHSEFTTSDACIICSGLGGMAGGAIFGGPAGALTGWLEELLADFSHAKTNYLKYLLIKFKSF